MPIFVVRNLKILELVFAFNVRQMDYDGSFIMQKTIDWSLMNDRMTIPMSICELLKTLDESAISPSRVLLACYQRVARATIASSTKTFRNILFE